MNKLPEELRDKLPGTSIKFIKNGKWLAWDFKGEDWKDASKEEFGKVVLDALTALLENVEEGEEKDWVEEKDLNSGTKGKIEIDENGYVEL